VSASERHSVDIFDAMSCIGRGQLASEAQRPRRGAQAAHASERLESERDERSGYIFIIVLYIVYNKCWLDKEGGGYKNGSRMYVATAIS
jgi:hypothetical protein